MAQQSHDRGNEIKVLSSNGMHPVLDELGPQFEHTSGHRIAVTYDTANQIMHRLDDGEAADMVIATTPVLDQLSAQARLVRGSRVNLARSHVGVAVRAGAAKPDVSSVDALKRALLAADSVTYTGTGASGIHFAKVLDRLGISDEIKAKAKIPPGGLVGELVARGEAQIAVQQISELMAVPGVEVVGPLPDAVQNTTQLSAAALAGSQCVEASRALIAFLSTPAAARVFEAKGMKPG